MRSAALRTSADSSTITGDFPPSSRVTVERFLAAAAITVLPILGLPVKKTWSKGRARRASETAGLPSNTATSSSGNRSERNRFTKAEVLGTLLEGLIITQLPAARAADRGLISRLNG